MGIKWEDVKILTSPLTNNIYIGKMDKKGLFATDKSDDRTDEVLATVMAHMDADVTEGKIGVVHKCEAGTLTWIRAGNPSREDLIKIIERAYTELTEAYSTTGLLEDMEKVLNKNKDKGEK